MAETLIKILNYKNFEKYGLSAFFLGQAFYNIANEKEWIDPVLISYNIIRPFVFCLLAFNSITRNEDYRINYKISLGLILSFGSLYFLDLKYHKQTNIGLLALQSGYAFYILTFFLGLINLGKSFSVIPSETKLKTDGLFKEIRHPLYSSYLHFFLLFLVANFSIRNLTMLILFYVGLYLRSEEEEKIMMRANIGYANLLKKPRFFSLAMTFPFTISSIGVLTDQYLSKKQEVRVNISYPVFSLNPISSDDWSSFFVINHIYPRFSSQRNSKEAFSIFRHKEIKCAEVGKTIFSSSCKRILVNYVLNDIKPCNGATAYNDQVFRKELNEIVQNKNWVFPNFKWCERESCFSFDSVSNIQNRFDSIYLRFGWSLAKNDTNVFGIQPNCFWPDSKKPPYLNGTVESDKFKIRLETNYSSETDIFLYGGQDNQKNIKTISYFNPIYYFFVLNEGRLINRVSITPDFFEALKKEMVRLKIIEKNTFNDTLLAPPKNGQTGTSSVSNSGELITVSIPDYWPNCSQIQTRLNLNPLLNNRAKFQCTNITLLVENDVKKNANPWDGFITPISPGFPGKDALTVQYFSETSSDNWLGTETPELTKVELLGVTNGQIQSSETRVCGIKTNPLGLSDILFEDLEFCD